MFYIKTEYHGKQIEVELYGDEIYTHCFKCGKEIQVDREMLLAVLGDGDLASTQISCCNENRPTLIRIK